MFVCQVCARTFPVGGFCTEDGGTLREVPPDPLIGQSIGSYRLVQWLGQGGMGTVYLGVHPTIGSRVAVKVLSMAASENHSLVERFFAEARSVNVIRHEGIVNVLDLATLPDGRPYIVMEHLEGAVLTRHFETVRPFPLGALVRLGVEVLGALGAAHALGIIHRDLKPDNIFVTKLGRAKVLDFGIAKLRPEQRGPSGATRTGALLGTPQYMSPEQALGQEVDPRADLYALGVILFEGATGRRPFDAESLFELLRLHVQEAAPAARSLRPDLPPALEQVISRALAKQREARFQTAEELASALIAVGRELPDASAELSGLYQPLSGPVAYDSRASHNSAPALAPTAVGTVSAGGASSSAGVSNTLGASRVTSPPRSNLGVFVGIAGVLVALLGLSVGGVALLFSTGVLSLGTAVKPTAEELEPGIEYLDITRELDRSREEARTKLPDAELVSISVAGKLVDGKLGLTGNSAAASYMFRSEQASKSTAECLVMVSHSAFGRIVSGPFADTSYKCRQETTRAPKCSVRQMVRPGTNPTSLTFHNQGDRWTWIIMEGSAIQILPDKC